MTDIGGRAAAGSDRAVHDHAGRRDRLRARLVDVAAERMLVTGPRNVRYLSGFTGSNGQVLVGAGAEDDRLITDARYDVRGGAEAPELERVLSRDPIGWVLREPGPLAVEAGHVTWAVARRWEQRAAEAGVTIVPTTGSVEELRLVKDDAELDRLARACRITEEALEWLVAEVVGVGRRERELAVALERRFVDLGADGVAFPSIVAAGPNAAVPHHAPTDRRVQDGDLLVVDCGALVDGYHADHTRTVAIGSVSDELAAVHAAVQRAQAAGMAAAVAGASGGDVDAAARGVLTDDGYGEAFTHGTGHGVGLDVHEAPAVARGAAGRLVANVVLTVEPGVYLPGVGGVRIEDTIVVTADGPARPLTDTPRGLRVR